MQHVSSFGGPRVLLPTHDIDRWIEQIGESPIPTKGLYGLACSVSNYCGIIRPWGTPFVIFGDCPGDIFWLPRDHGGLFMTWIGADTIEQLIAFALSVVDAGNWKEIVEWEVEFTSYTLMDTCTFVGDNSPHISLELIPGKYYIESNYAESEKVITTVYRLRLAR